MDYVDGEQLSFCEGRNVYNWSVDYVLPAIAEDVHIQLVADYVYYSVLSNSEHNTLLNCRKWLVQFDISKSLLETTSKPSLFWL